MDDVDKERLQAYRDWTSRCRWFVLITVLISSLMLTHLYLERWSYDEAQLIETLAIRLRRDTEGYVEQQEKIIENARGQPDAAPDWLLDEVAEMRYLVDTTNNDLEELKTQSRELPLLNLAVAWNDYLPVLAMMLSVFCIGVWLSLRSIYAVLLEIGKNPILIELARLHFTFTGLQAPASFVDRLAPFVQKLAIYMPSSSLLLCIALDVWPLVTAEMPYYAAGNIFQRVLVLSVALLLVAIASLGTLSIAEKIELAMQPSRDAARSASDGALHH